MLVYFYLSAVVKRFEPSVLRQKNLAGRQIRLTRKRLALRQQLFNGCSNDADPTYDRVKQEVNQFRIVEQSDINVFRESHPVSCSANIKMWSSSSDIMRRLSISLAHMKRALTGITPNSQTYILLSFLPSFQT
jgi:hypothetical protein